MTLKHLAVTSLAACVSLWLTTAAVFAQRIEEAHPNIMWGGRVVAVTVHSTDPLTTIAASESGGLFKTINGGSVWWHVGGLLPFRLTDVQMSPDDPNVVIVTAFADTYVRNQGGIWRSSDGGTTWMKPPVFTPPVNPRAETWGIAFEPGSRNVFVGNDEGIAISRDLGATWTHTGLGYGVTCVVAQRGGVIDIYSARGHQRSTDSGLSWGRVNSTVPGCSWNAVHSLAVSPLEGNVLYAITQQGGMRYVFESTDSGVTWTDLNLKFWDDRNRVWVRPGTSRVPFVKVRQSPAGGNRVDLYVGNGVGVSRQVNLTTGVSGLRAMASETAWQPIGVAHADVADLVFHPMTNVPLFLASDGGIQRTADGGATWVMAAGSGRPGFNALQIYEVQGQLMLSGTDLYIGTQDNDLWSSSDGGITWGNRVCCEGFVIQLNRQVLSRSGQLVTYVACGACMIRKSDALFVRDRGWTNPPPPDTLRGAPFLIGGSTYIQFATSNSFLGNRLYVTENAGENWRSVATVGQQLMSIPQIAGPLENPTVYQAVLTGGSQGPTEVVGLLKITNVLTRDPVRNPVQIVRADTGLNNIGVYACGQGTFIWSRVFGVNPRNRDHLIAADMGTGQMKYTRDGGGRWYVDTQLTDLVTRGGQLRFGGWGNMQAHVIAFNPSNPNEVLVGTEAAGIIFSYDGGYTWELIPGSERITAISCFFFGRENTVYVASYGRGLWRVTLPRRLSPWRALVALVCLPNCSWDIRDPHTGDLISLERFLDPEYCPICLYVAVIGSQTAAIRNIQVNEWGELKGVHLTQDSQLQLFDLEGTSQQPEFLVAAGGKEAIAQAYVSFSAFPAVRDVIKKGGIPKGLVVSKNMPIGVVFVYGAPTAAPPVITAARIEPVIGTPSLFIASNAPSNGEVVVPIGSTITVFGMNFCREDCLPVDLRIGDRMIRNVKQDKDGGFTADFWIEEGPGIYTVAAYQKDQKGKTYRAEATLIVPVSDLEQEGQGQ